MDEDHYSGEDDDDDDVGGDDDYDQEGSDNNSYGNNLHVGSKRGANFLHDDNSTGRKRNRK